MYRSLIIFLLIHSFVSAGKYLKIDLIRQKTPREYALNTKNNEKIGLYLDWLKGEDAKPKPPDNRTNDTIPLRRFLDSEYYGQINIGSPGQQFNMVFDTSWSDSWVISKDCSDSNIGCAGHNKYNHDRSSKYVENGTKIVFDEGSYQIGGYYSYDTMVIGHSRVKKQLFVEVNNISYINAFSKADGVMGLGFKVDDINPFFYNILQETKIKIPYFSIYLNRDRQSKKGGSIYLGGVDKKHIHVTNNVSDEITYVPVVTSNRNWNFHIDKVIIDKGKSYTIICPGGCNAIIDTSSNLMITSQDQLDIINLKIGARGNAKFVGRYEVDCDTANKLPKFEFVIAGKNFTLKGPNYIQKISNGSTVLCLSAFIAAHTVSEQNIWTLGGAFLAEYFSIYDVQNKRIGFVKAA